MRILIKIALVVFVLINTTGCNMQSYYESINEKIVLFEEYEKEYFNEINIHLIRSSGIVNKNRSYYANRNALIDSSETYAVFETKPNVLINRNFRNNQINTEFVEIFKQLDCTRLFNMSANTYLEFVDKNNKYFLFRGNIPPVDNYKNHPFEKFNENWNIIKTEYSSR